MLCKMEDEGASYDSALKGIYSRISGLQYFVVLDALITIDIDSTVFFLVTSSFLIFLF